MFVDPMAAKYGAQPDGYPSVHDGLSLVKSDTCESGYKGVSISRAGSITCFQARDGSCLSSRVLTAAGQRWIGLDVSREMLLLADRASLVSGVGALLHSDLGTGLPLRPSRQFDGAISVSALQWLCEPPAGGSLRDVRDALHRLFTSLHGVLRPGAAAVFQFYTTPAAAAGALEAAVECGFRADLIIDLPHATRARKLFLCVRAPVAPVESPKETRVARATHCEEAAGFAPSVLSVPRVRRRVCPIAWPFGAACICCSGWVHAPRPPMPKAPLAMLVAAPTATVAGVAGIDLSAKPRHSRVVAASTKTASARVIGAGGILASR